MPESSFDHPLFGQVRFRTVSPEWKRGDKIIFLSGFDLADVTPVFIPQLKDIPGSNKGKLRVHKRAHPQILEAFRLIERVRRHEIDPWLRQDAVAEFQAFL